MLILNSGTGVSDKLWQGVSLAASAKLFIDNVGRFLFPKPTLQRPLWFHFSDRSWNRHSAFIMVQHKSLDDRNSDG